MKFNDTVRLNQCNAGSMKLSDLQAVWKGTNSVVRGVVEVGEECPVELKGPVYEIDRDRFLGSLPCARPAFSSRPRSLRYGTVNLT